MTPPPSAGPASIASSLAEEAEAIFRSLRVIRRRVLARPLGLQTLPASYVELLNLIRRRPGLRVGEAAEELRLAPNTVSTLAARLADAGLVQRRRDDTDQRAVRFHLTPAAATEMSEWRDQRLDLLAQALGELEVDERDAINAALPALGHLVVLVRQHAAVAGSNAKPRKNGPRGP